MKLSVLLFTLFFSGLAQASLEQIQKNALKATISMCSHAQFSEENFASVEVSNCKEFAPVFVKERTAVGTMTTVQYAFFLETYKMQHSENPEKINHLFETLQEADIKWSLVKENPTDFTFFEKVDAMANVIWASALRTIVNTAKQIPLLSVAQDTALSFCQTAIKNEVLTFAQAKEILETKKNITNCQNLTDHLTPTIQEAISDILELEPDAIQGQVKQLQQLIDLLELNLQDATLTTPSDTLTFIVQGAFLAATIHALEQQSEPEEGKL